MCFSGIGEHKEVLQWARSQDPLYLWGEGVFDCAAMKGHLDVLHIQDPPCPWYTGVCTSAAANGHLDVLQLNLRMRMYVLMSLRIII